MKKRSYKSMITVALATSVLLGVCGFLFHGCGGGGSGTRDSVPSFEDRSTIFGDGDVNQGLCGDAGACSLALLSRCFNLDQSDLPEMFSWVASSVHLDAARVICRGVEAAGFRGGVSSTAEPFDL